jgi:hypothetical protein
MKVIGKPSQSLTDQKKEKPGEQNAEGALNDMPEAGEGAPFHASRLGQPFQA